MELPRIVAMFCIVCFHCSFKSAFIFDELTPNLFFVKALWYLGELGVNLFMLVTGFFLVRGRFKGSKFLLLLCQVLFYWVLTIGIAYALGIYTFPEAKRDFVLLFFPTLTGSYWYITAYVVIYALSPWINSFLKSIGQKQLIGFIAVLLLFYSITPTVFGFLGEEIEGMLSYTRLVWLFVIYVIGAYIALYPPKFLKKIRAMVILCFVNLALMLLFIGLIATSPGFFAKFGVEEWAVFWPPNTVPMVCLSIGVFGLFLNLRIANNRVINRIASATLGVYLLHDGVLQGYIWRTGVFHSSSLVDSAFLVPYILIACILVFSAGIAIDMMRQVLEGITVRPLLKSAIWKAFVSRGKSRLSSFADKLIEDTDSCK